MGSVNLTLISLPRIRMIGDSGEGNGILVVRGFVAESKGRGDFGFGFAVPS